jgi:hypothetical protein
VQSHYGAAEILQCDVDGNPQPDVYWTHEDSERILATASNISVVVRPETAGRYYCHARVPGFPELTGSANIYIRAPPSIISQRTQYVPDEGLVKVRLAFLTLGSFGSRRSQRRGPFPPGQSSTESTIERWNGPRSSSTRVTLEELVIGRSAPSFIYYGCNA